MSTKAKWLLDLDGVINACPRNPDPPPAIWDHWISVEISNAHSTQPWPILAAKPVLDFIIEHVSNGLVEVLWHSTWQEEANKVGQALGLPEFDVLAPLALVDQPKGRVWWKLPPAQQALRDSQGHVIWTDDEATTPSLPMGERRLWKDAGALVIAPNGYQGLSKPNLDKILFYLTGELPPEPAIMVAA